MGETPKDEREKKAPEKPKTERSYYYDDAHGYQDYDPKEDEPETEDGEPTETEPRSARY